MPGLSSFVSGSQSYRSTSKCLMQGLADSLAGRSLSQCQMPLNSQRGLLTCFTHLFPDFGCHLWSDSVATSLLALSLFSVHTIEGTRWPCGTVPDLRPRGCCVPTPTQRVIPLGSVNEYQRKLGSKRAYRAMH